VSDEPAMRAGDDAAQTTISAGFVKIFGLGTLILGDSGVGKSESALELIARGHQFIADDVVQIGSAPRAASSGRPHS